MATALTTTNASGVLEWTQEQMNLIKATVAKGTTNDEFKLFLEIAKGHGLNPFTKEIWCIKRDQSAPPQIMTSHQGYINAARRNYPSKYKNLRSFVVHQGDEFEFDAMTQEVKKHVVKGERGKCLGAWAIAEDQQGNKAAVFLPFDELFEACKTNPLWRTRPTQMILKTAEVHVLRRMFPISGIYTQEEMSGDHRLEVVENSTPSVDPKEYAEKHTEPAAAKGEPVMPEVVTDGAADKAKPVLNLPKKPAPAEEAKTEEKGAEPPRKSAPDPAARVSAERLKTIRDVLTQYGIPEFDLLNYLQNDLQRPEVSTLEGMTNADANALSVFVQNEIKRIKAQTAAAGNQG